MNKKPTVAILGASSQRHKFGNKSLRAHRDAGYEVVPIHPREETVEGEPVVPSLDQVEVPLERITVYLPPPVTQQMLPAIAASGAKEVWFNPGSADSQVLKEAREMGIAAIDGCSIVDLGRSPSQYS